MSQRDADVGASAGAPELVGAPELAGATGRSSLAEGLIEPDRERLRQLAARAAALGVRPRVFCMQGVDPMHGSGHRVPEMVRLAGGRDELGREDADAAPTSWEQVLRWAPEVLIIMPFGLSAEKAADRARPLFERPGWSELPAVQAGRVYVVDARVYFGRAGPGVVEGVELLAHLIHPAAFEWHGSPGALRKLGSDGRTWEEDFYLEGAYKVFTASYHLRRGYCCGNGCRHCPYGLSPQAAP